MCSPGPRRPEDLTQRDEKTQDSPNGTAMRPAPIQGVIQSTSAIKDRAIVPSHAVLTRQQSYYCRFDGTQPRYGITEMIDTSDSARAEGMTALIDGASHGDKGSQQTLVQQHEEVMRWNNQQ
jgi:hypothetical protein